MGNYLSSYLGNYLGYYLHPPKPKTASPPPAQGHWSPRPRPTWAPRCTDYLYPGRWQRTRPLPKIPPGWEHVNLRKVLVSKAWRGFPNKLPPQAPGGPDLSSAWETYLRHQLWAALNPSRIWSPVTVQIAPPGRRRGPATIQAPGALYAMCSPSEQCQDPCAKEAVLQALSQCNKGKKKFDGPLWFEVTDDKRGRRSPEARRSAFRPVVRNGVVRAFVPRRGPLNRGPRSWSCSICDKKTVLQPAAQGSPTAAQPLPSATQPAVVKMPASIDP